MRLRDARASDTQAPESLAPSTACSFLLSSVSVVLQFLLLLPRVPVEMFCLAGKHFISLTQVARVSRFRVPTTFRSRHSTFG